MKVLLITYSFPPAAGVGVLRAHSLAKYLPECGIHVEVLTARNAAAVGKDSSLLAQLSAEVGIHRTWALDLPFGLRKAIKKMLSRSGRAVASVVAPADAKGAKQPFFLKRWIADLLLPDPQVGWLPFALPAARRLIRSQKIDVVLITVPPFSSAMLVTRLRKVFPELPIVLDFRDEWLSTTLDLVSFNKNERARAVAAKAEAEAVRDATAVVCVTEAALDAVRGRYPQENAGKLFCVPNGFDTALPVELPAERLRGTDEATVLTYIGTVYGSTDPTKIVDAVMRMPIHIRERLKLRFIGHIETPAYRATLLRLGEGVELIGFLPQAEALRFVASTDYLLLITHDPINVAAKLYDYLGSGRPILAAVHGGGEVRKIVEKTRAGWAADIDDPVALERLLIDAVERTPRLAEEFHPDLGAIAEFHRKPLAARYAALLRSLMEVA